MTRKKHIGKSNPRLNAKKVHSNLWGNEKSDFQSFFNNYTIMNIKDNSYGNEEISVTRLEVDNKLLEIDKKINITTENINKDLREESKKKDASSNFHLFSNSGKKNLKKNNIFQRKNEEKQAHIKTLEKQKNRKKQLQKKAALKKEKQKQAHIKTLEKQKQEKKLDKKNKLETITIQKLEAKQATKQIKGKRLKKKKIKTDEKTGFGWKGLENKIESNDSSINEPSLKTVSNEDHSWAIDSLMNGIESTNIKNEEKQGFFEKIYSSSSNLLNRGNSTGEEFDYPEFLSTIPFETNSTSKQDTLRKMGLLKTSKSGSLSKNNVSQTEMVKLEKIETTLPVDNDTKINIKEEIESPLITEMEIKDKDTTSKKSKVKKKDKWLFTGIKGFDALLEKGIPAGSNIIVAGGPGCGKTIFCSQVIYNKAAAGEDCVFLSMEERPERLKEHMLSFGYKVEEISRSEEQIILRADGKGKIALKRLQPIRLARSIEALLEKASGTLPVNIDLVLDFIPKGFDACLLALDSISAIETAFSGTKRQYRIYIEQLFRYFEEMNLTTFMITESSDAPHKFSNTGVEEFLSDGIFVFYNLQGVKKRTRGAEIYKLRGAAHSQRIVPVEITSRGLIISSDETTG